MLEACYSTMTSERKAAPAHAHPEAVLPLVPFHSATMDTRELEYIAFSGQYEIAHSIFRSIPGQQSLKYANKYVLSQVIHGGIQVAHISVCFCRSCCT